MPRSPSSRALSNRVSLFRAVVAQDEDGGRVVTYGAAFATDVPCSVQPSEGIRMVDGDTDRLEVKTMWDVFFARSYSLGLDDKITWASNAGPTRTLYVHDEDDQAGRGGCFVARAEERK